MAEPLPGPVVLIGPMGAGKTSIGRRVAKALGARFVDTDREIVRQHGPIGVLFERHGEPHFRALEREAVAAALTETSVVVSLGGGAILDPATRELLGAARVVHLTVTPDAVAARIAGTDRPVLGDQGLTAWKAVAAERAPVYAQLADLTLDTSHRPLSHVVADIVNWVRTDSE